MTSSPISSRSDSFYTPLPAMELDAAIQTGDIEAIEDAIAAGANPDCDIQLIIEETEDSYSSGEDYGWGAQVRGTRHHQKPYEKRPLAENEEKIACLYPSLRKAIHTKDPTIVKTVIRAGAWLYGFGVCEELKRLEQDGFSNRKMLQLKKYGNFAKRECNCVIEAIETENMEIITTIFEAVSSRGFLWRPRDSLAAACATRKKEIVQAVITQVQSSDHFQWSSHTLNFAIESGDLQIFRLAFQAGARPHAKSLCLAIKTGSIDMVEAVIAEGALPNDASLNESIKTGKIKFAEAESCNSLNCAIETRDIRIIKAVLRAGAMPLGKTFNLAIATQDAEIIRCVAAAGVKPQDSSLDLAMETTNPEIVRAVLESKPKVSHRHEALAKATGNEEILQLIQGQLRLPCCALS